jgi:hypothetical protein
MRYISVSDVIQPPHTAEAISDHTFQELLSYESETVQLMRLLPALRTEVAWGWNQEGVEILPGSKAVNYFINHDTDWIDYLRYGDNGFSANTKLLPPWMLRLTIGDMYSGQNGIDLIYDTKTRMCYSSSPAHDVCSALTARRDDHRMGSYQRQALG